MLFFVKCKAIFAMQRSTPLNEQIENQYVDKLNIIRVPLGGLKRVETKIIKI